MEKAAVSGVLITMLLVHSTVHAGHSKPRIPTSCKGVHAPFKAWLNKLTTPHRVAALAPHDAARLVKLSRAPFLGVRHPVVRLTRDAVHLDGTEVATAVDAHKAKLQPLTERIKIIRHNMKVVGQAGPLRALIAAERGVPWFMVARVVEALQLAKVSTVGFLFATNDPTRPPGPSPIDGALKKLQKGPLRPAVGVIETWCRIWDQVAARCPKLRCTTMDRFSSMYSAKKHVGIAKHVLDGLKACKCAADVASLKSLLYPMLHERPTSVVWRDLGGKGRITLRADTAWSKAYRKVVAGGLKKRRKLRLVVK